MRRSRLIAVLAERIAALAPERTVRVGIDGIDTAGKTTLAEELAGPVAERGRPVIRASIDGFHRPRAERYAKGSVSPEGYFEDSFDLEALRRVLLDPLGPGGSGRYRTALFDHRTDRPVVLPDKKAESGAVLLFDGVFLASPPIAGSWDFRIFIAIGFETCIARARIRDASVGEPPDAVESRYRTRYVPGQKIYLERCRPAETADAVVTNDDPSDPGLALRL